MISIMQQYGEVVCVLGSSPNAENIGIFMQADARYLFKICKCSVQ